MLTLQGSLALPEKKLLHLAYRRHVKLFGPCKVNVVFCSTQEEFKQEAKYYYMPMATGVTLRNGTIVVKNIALAQKSNWRREQYGGVLCHEINHAFWYARFKTWSPLWLCEGMACHVSGTFIVSEEELQKIISAHTVDGILDYRYLPRRFNNSHLPRYPVWAMFTRYLVQQRSLGHLIRFLDAFSKHPSKHSYEQLFRKHFGASDKVLYAQFLKQYRE